MADNAVYIPSIDAKDIWISSHYINDPASTYSLITRAGNMNTRKFINTLDYSLDLIQLREVYRKVYRNKGFSFRNTDKEYCKHVINVTFKYAVKGYNRLHDNTYIKFGYGPKDIQLDDNVCIRAGELIAIRTGKEVEQPIDRELLGKYFRFTDGEYQAKGNPSTIRNVAQLRTDLYKNGFVCDGIRYVRYKRSSGSSRVGKCLFINAELYDRMHQWEMCGLDVQPGQSVDLAALESYIALSLSSIIGTLKINPENILVIDDHESRFRDDVIRTTYEEDQGLVSRPGNAEITNSIWDGQSLISQDAMGPYKHYGFILLRNRFFKSACFNTNLAQWFADQGITQVAQLNGFTLAKDISQIKLITTPSSIKYMKFGPVEKWLKNIDPLFGVVKHEKKTHFFDGRMVQTHYQLLNSLQMSLQEAKELLAPSLAYLTRIKTDPAVFRFHINYTTNDSDMPSATRNDVFYRFLGHNERFAKTKLYYDFRKDTVKAFLKQLRHGHILVPGTYSTLFGNPVEMLLQAIGKFDGRSRIGVGNVHSSRFAYNQVLLGSRSPHVSMANVLLATNKDCPDIRKYFNLTSEIVCINSIGENILSRLSGADFDSDTMLLTDSKILIDAAQRNYHAFPVATSFVPAQKIERRYTATEQADLDIKTAVNKIGEIVNLSQELNTLIWQKVNCGMAFDAPEIVELCNDVSTLNVLSNIEIDKAKREFPVDSRAEINRIREKHCSYDCDSRKIKPSFFGVIAKSKGYYNGERNNYLCHLTTMDFIQEAIASYKLPRPRGGHIAFSDVLDFDGYNAQKVKYSQAYRIFEAVRQSRQEQKRVWLADSLDYAEKYALVNESFLKVKKYLDSFKLSNHTILYLIRTLECDCNKDIRRSLFTLLFSKHDFYQMVKESKTKIQALVEDTDGTIPIYQFSYSKVEEQ